MAAQGGSPEAAFGAWLRDVRVEVAPLETTGGKVWGAAHELCWFLECRAGDLGLDGGGGAGRADVAAGRACRVLEIGAGCGWLGICLARNVPGVQACLTEQPAGMEHLQRNVELNRLAGVPVGGISAAVLDWGDCERSELLQQNWDLVIGSDLLYGEQGLTQLPALFGRLAGPRTRVLYAHTLHRYDHLDVDFFAALEAAGLEWREVGAPPPEGEAFLQELFPEERAAVFEIAHRDAGARCQPPLAVGSPRPAAPAPPPPAAAAGGAAGQPADLGIAVLLPGEPEPEQGSGGAGELPWIRLAVVGPFGNASHPTTRLVLRWLASPPGREAARGAAVCDYGCGSGVLGLAALRHGAGSCSSVDNDPEALAATAANAAASGLQVAAHLPPAETLRRDLDFFSRFGDWRAQQRWRPLPPSGEAGGGPFDLVLCNIVVGPLCGLAGTLHGLCRPGGWVVLAGFRGDHFQRQVEDAYAPFFDLTDSASELGWHLLAGPRRAA